MFIGVDVGTRNIKFGLYGEDLEQVDLVATATPWTAIKGLKTLDPQALLRTVIERIERFLEDREVRVAGVGIASMAEVGFIESDASMFPMPMPMPMPTPSWFDERGAGSAKLLLEHFGDQFAVMTGRSPSPVCTVAKLHDMGLSEALPPHGRFHSVAEWVAYRLGGDPVAEASLASRTGLLDIRRGVACDEVMLWCGLRPTFLPELRGATEGVGAVRGVHPRVDGAALAVAGHDHLAAMVGVGATQFSEVLDSCGTAEAIVMNADESLLLDALDVTRAGGSVSRHVLPDRSAAFAPSFRSGAVLQKVLDELGVDISDTDTLRELDDQARTLVGRERAPELPGLVLEPIEWPEALKAATPAQKWAAAIDSVGATGARRLAILEAILGPAARVHVTGGWSHGSAVRRVKQVLSDEVVFSPFSEAGARGAALIAAGVTGLHSSIIDTQSSNPAKKGHQL